MSNTINFVAFLKSKRLSLRGFVGIDLNWTLNSNFENQKVERKTEWKNRMYDRKFIEIESHIEFFDLGEFWQIIGRGRIEKLTENSKPPTFC